MVQSRGRAFVGDIANPVTDARLSISMSLNALAKRLGLSRQYISRVEQGTYASVNPNVVSWTAETLEIPKKAVMDRYRAFQSATRKATAEDVNAHPLERRGSRENGYEIFARWRSGYWPSVISFANSFCIHPETVRMYEEGIRPHMPEQIREALEEVNLIDENWSDTPNDPRTPKAVERRLRA